VRAHDLRIKFECLLIRLQGQRCQSRLFVDPAHLVYSVGIADEASQCVYHLPSLLWPPRTPVQLGQITIRHRLRGLKCGRSFKGLRRVCEALGVVGADAGADVPEIVVEKGRIWLTWEFL
jgi:hypothetical protein